MTVRHLWLVAAIALAADPAAAAPARAATPTFSPAAGTFSGPVSVTISDATAGAKIYYTTNGTTPTTTSTLYSGPIAVTATTTVKALAAAAGYANSAIASATYTLATATPTFSPAAGTFSGPVSVTISDATAGAKIYYTTNGTTPTTASTLYSGPIAVNATTTVKALAAATGYANSSVASATYTLATATPTFSPVGGTYNSAQSVALSSATPGAKIYYTTNGTTPTTASALYTSAIAISATTTVKALAAAAGLANSSVASAIYTLATATPTFSPAAGTYNSPQSVALASTTPGAKIYYTTDGKAPSTSSSLYSSPVTVVATTTLKALAAATGYTNSSVASAAYNLVAATPVFAPAGGAYNGTRTVSISDVTPGAQIYFTTDGTTPTARSTPYGGPISLPVGSTTLKALATAAGYTNSSVATATYSIKPLTATPTFDPPAGTYGNRLQVSINDATPGAQIYYTTDGTTPTTTSPRYTGSPVEVGTSLTLKAVAVAAGYANSATATAAYVLPPPAATPTITPPAGTYYSPQLVTISDATPGAQIYYSEWGGTPSTLYTGPFTLSESRTVTAQAGGPEFLPSSVESATYTILLPAPPPSVTPLPGAYPAPQRVTLFNNWAPAEAQAQIYYTVDGTVPTASSNLYTEPIVIATNTTLQALSIAPGYTESAVVGGLYSISPANPEGIATQFTISATNTRPWPLSFSTTGTDVLLLLFVSAAGPLGTPIGIDASGPGDVQWEKIQLANSERGAVGIWKAYAPFPVTNSYVSASPTGTWGRQTVTLVALEGAHRYSYSTGAASGPSGSPSLTLNSTSAGSWFYGVGGDSSSATPHTPGPSQTILSEFTGDGVDQWVQMLAEPAGIRGMPLTLNSIYPTTGSWNFAGIEVVPAVIPKPTFSPPAGTYDRPQNVTITSQRAYTTTYYTTDETTPDANSSPRYSGPIAIGSTTELRAITVESSGRGSSVLALVGNRGNLNKPASRARK